MSFIRLQSLSKNCVLTNLLESPAVSKLATVLFSDPNQLAAQAFAFFL